MKNIALALVAFALAAPAAAQDVAPAVKRKPVTVAPVARQQAVAAPAPAAPAPGPDASAAPADPRPAPVASAAPPAPQPAGRSASERDFQAALTAAAAQGGTDPALDTSLIRVMSRLAAAGRCGEAVGLANRGGRKELASRAQQLCK